MTYCINPLTDSRWDAFISCNPSASIFHTSSWLRALQRTYGFTPLAFTYSAPGQDLTNALLFCRVRSVLTGRRLVSIPFADHCQPLAEAEDLPGLLESAHEMFDRDRLKYIELRPLNMPAHSGGFVPANRYLYHLLDLRPSLDDIQKRFHVDCVRRKIRRANREGLTVETGRSPKLLDSFYRLQVSTRQKHGLPPQPRKWFENLVTEMGEKAIIMVAYYNSCPVAAILILHHGKVDTYKYGCSDVSENKRGGMQLLLWHAIEDAKFRGMEAMDLGRCDLDAAGLAQFKERWGAEVKELTYYRYPSYTPRKAPMGLMGKLPKSVLKLAGRLFYKHMT